jgi:microcystin-dependent protein
MPSIGFVVPNPRYRAFDASGNPLAAGKLYTYASGTSTPLAAYQDALLTIPHANPIVLDANGEATVYIPDGVLYKFVLKNSLDATQHTIDPVEISEPIAPAAPDNVPVATVFMTGAAAAPTGYLLCDGSAVSRATYAALFAAVGTIFGAGDGSTTFNIPDMRGRFPLGKAAAGTGSVLGGTGGTIDHVHTGPSHTHDVVVPRDNWGSNLETPPTTARMRVGNAAGGGPDNTGYYATANQTVASAAGGTGNTGTANPPFTAFNYIIKT